jgi:hypothetical protein
LQNMCVVIGRGKKESWINRCYVTMIVKLLTTSINKIKGNNILI